MRITFVLPPVSMSGGIRVVAIYAKILTERGHEVTIVSPPRQAMPLWQKLKSLANARGWPTSKPQASYLDGLEITHRVIDRYRPIVDEDIPDSDVVIATWWETAEWVNSLSPRKGAKVYFVQGHEIFPHCPKDRVIATYHMDLQKITISKWLAEVMKTTYKDDCVDLVR